jgi:hypothetical protein
VDFTRRNDPACLAAYQCFSGCLEKREAPSVLCFWTKAPNTVAAMYEKEIQMLQEQGTLVLCQTTLNLGGYRVLEPNITRDAVKLGKLISLLGSPKHIRARFDPIIFGFTTPKMFAEHCKYIAGYGITRTTVNFMVFSYKDIRDQFKAKGFPVAEPTLERKRRTLETISEIASRYNIEVAVCAETSAYAGQIPGILPARCSDPNWALSLLPDLSERVKGHPSRKGCGCIYSDDWGIYRNKGGWSCPHQCIYCYAK